MISQPIAVAEMDFPMLTCHCAQENRAFSHSSLDLIQRCPFAPIWQWKQIQYDWNALWSHADSAIKSRSTDLQVILQAKFAILWLCDFDLNFFLNIIFCQYMMEKIIRPRLRYYVYFKNSKMSLYLSLNYFSIEPSLICSRVIVSGWSERLRV